MMFVLLEHSTSDGVHWDFMIEVAGQDRLATWRLTANPAERPGGAPAERIGDHRRAYLEYEGEVSGGRGSVRRVDRGEAVILVMDGSAVEMDLAGRLLRGRYTIRSRRVAAPLLLRRMEAAR